MLGIDHAELGGLIARSWGLPDSLVRGIREHGRPSADGDVLVHAVYLADVLAKACVSEDVDETEALDGHEAAQLVRTMDVLGLNPTDFDELCDLVFERLAEVERRFD